MRRIEGEKDRKFIQKSNGWDFPGGSVVKNPSASAEDMDSNPGKGTKVPHVSEWLSPRAATAEPMLAGEPTCHT